MPYEYSSLEPFIDTHTLALHYNKHQKNYLKNLNNILNKNNYNYNYSLEELTNHIKEFKKTDQEAIMFNLGGTINHKLYFSSINPHKTMPNDVLMNLINDTFENYDQFKKAFKEKALSIKGSGYTYLVLKDNKLEIINLLNQDNPYNYNMIPLITLDMWEHAYYLNYENKKDIYIDNFFEIINFTEANKLFNKI